MSDPSLGVNQCGHHGRRDILEVELIAGEGEETEHDHVDDALPKVNISMLIYCQQRRVLGVSHVLGSQWDSLQHLGGSRGPLYWVTQKLLQCCTVILRICIGKVAYFAVYICSNFWVTQ